LWGKFFKKGDTIFNYSILKCGLDESNPHKIKETKFLIIGWV